MFLAVAMPNFVVGEWCDYKLAVIKFYRAYTVKKIYCIFIGSKSTERTVIFLPLQIVNIFTEIFSESVYGC